MPSIKSLPPTAPIVSFYLPEKRGDGVPEAWLKLAAMHAEREPKRQVPFYVPYSALTPEQLETLESAPKRLGAPNLEIKNLDKLGTVDLLIPFRSINYNFPDIIKHRYIPGPISPEVAIILQEFKEEIIDTVRLLLMRYYAYNGGAVVRDIDAEFKDPVGKVQMEREILLVPFGLQNPNLCIGVAAVTAASIPILNDMILGLESSLKRNEDALLSSILRGAISLAMTENSLDRLSEPYFGKLKKDYVCINARIMI